VLAIRFKGVLLGVISLKQFGFFEGRQIHEAIGTTQEGLHYMKSKNKSNGDGD
jgi:hypothetical protein